MRLFSDHKISHIHHYAPLHYLPFIARSRSLKSKPLIKKDGFGDSHFRSRSNRSDVSRGFGEYTFLTLAKNPVIVKAKLKGGFPHINIRVPISAFENIDFDLCRYNVAMTRKLRRGKKRGFEESPINGRYYGGRQIPIARTAEGKKEMVDHHYPLGTMIEVLVPEELKLPDNVLVTCYDEADLIIVRDTLKSLDVPWGSVCEEPMGPYNRDQEYADQVEEFLEKALGDPNWRGDGLEFDNV